MSLSGFFSKAHNVSPSRLPWTDTSEPVGNSAVRSVDIPGPGDRRARLVFTSGDTDILQQGSRTVVITGDISWRDSDLSDIAAQNGNAAALESAFLRSGAEAFDRINGGFTAAIIDSEANKVTLALDRMGIGRVVYKVLANTIVFSDKIHDVTAFTEESPEVRPQAIFEYLFFHEIPSPGTIFEDIHKLGPGQFLEYENGNIEVRQYWMPRFAADSKDRPSFDELFDLCRGGIRRHFNGQGVSTFLSGGLDSSTVTALASEFADSPIPAVSIGFDAPGFDEMYYANIIARQFPVDHKQYYVTAADVRQSAPLIAANCDEPFGNSSIVPTYHCAKIGKEIGSDVMLAGDGGDELFGGNERYAKQRLFEMFGYLPAPVQALSSGIAERTAESRIMPLRKFSRYVEQARVPLPDRLETYNMLMRAGLEEVFTAEFLTKIRPEGPFEMMRTAYERPTQTDSLNRMLYLDWKFTLADNDLRKVTMGSSLAGTTAVFPLLDLDVVDFSMRLKRTDKLRGRTLRPFFRDACATILPKETIKKGKHGFGLPFGLWMLSDEKLHSLANDAVASFSQRGILRKEFIAWLQEQHRSDHASYYGSTIWAIMMLELWLSNWDASLA